MGTGWAQRKNAMGRKVFLGTIAAGMWIVRSLIPETDSAQTSPLLGTETRGFLQMKIRHLYASSASAPKRHIATGRRSCGYRLARSTPGNDIDTETLRPSSADS